MKCLCGVDLLDIEMVGQMDFELVAQMVVYLVIYWALKLADLKDSTLAGSKAVQKVDEMAFYWADTMLAAKTVGYLDVDTLVDMKGACSVEK